MFDQAETSAAAILRAMSRNHFHRMAGPPSKSEKQSRLPDINVQINGRTIAKILREEIARVHEHSTQAPYMGRGMFAGPDHQFAVG